jgi:hypothetical protein
MLCLGLCYQQIYYDHTLLLSFFQCMRELITIKMLRVYFEFNQQTLDLEINESVQSLKLKTGVLNINNSSEINISNIGVPHLRPLK